MSELCLFHSSLLAVLRLAHHGASTTASARHDTAKSVSDTREEGLVLLGDAGVAHKDESLALLCIVAGPNVVLAVVRQFIGVRGVAGQLSVKAELSHTPHALLADNLEV